MDTQRNLELKDLPEGIIDFAEVFGISTTMEIIEFCGGGVLYFPSKSAVLRNARNRAIKDEFDGGNLKKLSRKYGICEMQVRNILKS